MKPCTVLTLSLCGLLALLGSPASAEILYDREGIQLQGTARIVSRNAATCNVLEEKYSPEEYQKMKANQGRPLHVWQLDISAHNLTGKPLDFLSATFNIESPWPPCTNWSGEGPGGGPSGDFVDAEGQPQPVSWAGALKVLSMPYGMRVGQVERDTVFLAVFHEDRPVFKNWSVDFTFARQGSQGRQAPGAAQSREDPPRAAPRQRVELPPEILADKYLRQAEQLVQEKDYEGARKAMENSAGPAAGAWPGTRSGGPFPLRPDLVGGGGPRAGHGGGGALPADPGPGGRALRGGSGPDQPRRRRAGPGRVGRRREGPGRVVPAPGGGDGGVRRDGVRGDSPGGIFDGLHQPACGVTRSGR